MTADIRLLRWPERDREDYERLAGALERIRAAAARGRGEIVATLPVGPEEPSDAERARALLAQRRSRDAGAGSLADLFGEPGWDILLTLFIAYEDERVLVMDALSEAVPLRPAVLERWLTVLKARGLIRSIRMGSGAPQMSLTDDGLALVLRCMSGA